MDRFGLLRTVLPEVADLQGLEHSPDKHPKGRLRAHAGGAARLGFPDPAVNLAVLLHDVGKRSAHVVEDGRHRYHGHEGAGAGLVDAIARRLFLPLRIRRRCSLPSSTTGVRPARRVAAFEASRAGRERAVAGAAGARTLRSRGARGPNRRRTVRGGRPRGGTGRGRRCPRERGGGAVISGDRIMALTGLTPGPRVGAVQRR